MNNQDNTLYAYENRLKDETTLELFDKYYLSVYEKRLKRVRDYKLELAILNPEARHVRKFAFQWLAGAGIAGLAGLFLLNLLPGGPDQDNFWIILAATAAALLLTVLFIGLFAQSANRKWIFETRAAHYPLVEIPYHSKDKKQAQQFVKMLEDAIENNISAKGYNNEHLFAGEMRMLRRLAKKQILSNNNYNKAKKHMLEKNGHMGLAS